MGRRLIVALVAALVASLALAATAGAGKPQQFSFSFEDSFVDTQSCSFPVEVSFVGTISGLEFFDKSGNLVRVQAKGKDVGTVTNPANGKTASGVDNWLETFDVASGEYAIRGLYFHLNFPGAGIVLLDAGHIRFDANGDVIHLAGPHQAFQGDFAAMCAALA